MVVDGRNRHRGVMSESDSEAPEASSSEKFEPSNLRTIAGVHRATGDRWVAGVASGVARHLNIDPVIVRIGFIGLTFIGLSGLILYVAGWFFLPSDDGKRSVAADWFNLDENEEQVRTVGLFVALVLSILTVVGDGGWGWSFGFAWVLVPLAFLYWLFAVRPRQKRAAMAAFVAEHGAATADASGDPNDPLAAYVAEKKAEAIQRIRLKESNRQSRRALFLLTVSVAAIAEAITLIVDRAGANVRGETYLVVALGAVAVGCLIGSLWGTAGGGLKFVGIALSVALALSALNLSGPVGQQVERPTQASEVKPRYDHSVGEFVLDLSDVSNPEALAGRDIDITMTAGESRIYVPDGVPVSLHADLTAGEIRAFGEERRGHRRGFDIVDDDGSSAKVLTINLDQTFGDVEVSRR